MGADDEAGPVLSAILPVFNVERGWVQEAVESVRAIAIPVELLIIDDGSTTPRLVEYLASLPSADRRIRYIRQENAGVAAARNRGIDSARGTWLTFIDPDDRVRPHVPILERLADLSEIDVVLTGGLGFPADGGPVSETYSLASLSSTPTATDVITEMFGLYSVGRQSAAFVIGVPWSKFIRRSFLVERSIRFDESIVKRSDAEWVIRLLDRSPNILVEDDAFIEYRVDVVGSISNRYRPGILEGYMRVMRTAEACERVPKLSLQLYSVELIKDAINNVFSSPVAPASAVGRTAYREFRQRFSIPGALGTPGALAAAGPARRILFVVIRRGWYLPIAGLRWVKRIRLAMAGRARASAAPSGVPSRSSARRLC
ncbi:glycosyltransferase [Agromyces intestinalis]|uniref:Glycosyltransferase n=1 Tax=Agromyces intestinalis TaxID=2592652 RepID=A0A5C1YC59_9MICO|nr:glycosyltransferase [Agromyces intestinalis]QEO13673.1 glycosyltransferase [Agromyces intestinalis]